MKRVDEYFRLRQLEQELSVQAIQTQNPEIEEKRIDVNIKKVDLLFELSDEELKHLISRL